MQRVLRLIWLTLLFSINVSPTFGKDPVLISYSKPKMGLNADTPYFMNKLIICNSKHFHVDIWKYSATATLFPWILVLGERKTLFVGYLLLFFTVTNSYLQKRVTRSSLQIHLQGRSRPNPSLKIYFQGPHSSLEMVFVGTGHVMTCPSNKFLENKKNQKNWK
jgi:hypothetical protein